MNTVTALPVRPSPVPTPPAAAAALSPVLALPPVTTRLRLFTVAEYHRLIRDGYFAHDERFELLDGLIVRKMPKDPIHEAVLLRARRVLVAALPAGWHVRSQSPVTLSESEPEPDLSIAPGDELDWGDRHPGPADVPLVIEVSNSTLTDDRNWKGPVYARDRIPLYWILNVPNWRVEVYSDPSGDDSASIYRRREDFVSGVTVSLPLTSGLISVSVDDLMPPQLRSPVK
jgi:Uma2 family endonuclease